MEWKTIPNARDYEMSETGTIRRKKDWRTVEVGVLALLWCRGRQEWKEVRKLYAATFGKELPAHLPSSDGEALHPPNPRMGGEALRAKNRRLEMELAHMLARMNAAGIV